VATKLANAVTTHQDATALPGPAYRYRVAAFNAAGTRFSNTVDVTGTTPVGLTAPTNLTATPALGPTRVTLNWSDVNTTETGFTIQRARNAGFSSSLVIYTVGANILTFLNNTDIQTGLTYYYRVRAEGPGGPSAWSNTAIVGPPTAPTGPTATRGAGTSVIFRWNDNSTNETGFRIDRSTNGGQFVLLTTAAAVAGTGQRTFTDNTSTAGNTYVYRVRANGTWGNSAYAVAPSITIP
jgi:hypothetical protein